MIAAKKKKKERNDLGLSDNSVDLSFYAVTTVSRDYRVPIRSRPGGVEEKEGRKKKGACRRLYVRIHTPAAIGTTLMHARLPWNADARTRRANARARARAATEMIYSSWRRERSPA